MNEQTSSPLPSIEKPKSGATAVGVSNFMASNNKGTFFDAGMSVASAMPDSKVAKAFGTVDALSRAASAANQGSMLGAGIALAGAVPGSEFSNVMGKVGAASNLMSALQGGSPMGVGMALAGIAPGSALADVMGQVSQAKQMFDMGMSIFKPNMNPADLIKYIQPPEDAAKTPSKSVAATYGGEDGAFIKGEGIKCEACALANQEAMVGAPVNALYGSKVLVGGDDIDYRGNGYLPFVMSRIYNSQNPDTGWFGQGWTTQGYEQRLELDPQHNRIYLVDNSGRRVPFTYLAPDQSCYQPSEGITLYRKPLAEDKKHTTASSRPIVAGATNGSRIGEHEPLEFILYQGDYNPKAHNIDAFNGVAQHYSYVASRRHHGTEAVVLLNKYTDKYGHQNQLHYTRSALQGTAYLPQYLTDDANNCYEFEFTTYNEQPRLTSLYKLESLKSKQLLAEYSYSTNGDLIKVNVQGRTTREFAYKEHLMVWQSQASDQQVTYQYDRYDNPKAARIIEQAISTGRHYLFEYGTDTSGIDSIGTTTVTEQSGTALERTRHYTYDDWYNMLSLTDPNGNTTRYNYDDNNRTIKVTRANNSHTNYNYQGNHLAIVQVQTGIDSITQLPEYREASFTYNKAGQLIAGTDALGNQQQYRYNAQGNPIVYRDALGNDTQFQYDRHGNLTTQTLANGSQFIFDYDDYGNLLTQTDCSGYQTRYQYDDKQRLLEIINAEGARTRYHYNNTAPHLESLISQVNYPDGSRIQMDYDDLGRLITYTDTLGQQVTYQYDSAGNPSKRTEDSEESANTVKRFNAKGNSIAYRYDELGRLTTLINENGEKWTFEYDANDNLIHETRFDAHQSRYVYNDIGQLTQQIDNPQLPRHKQHHVMMDYDLIGQMTARHSSHYPELIGSDANKPVRPQYHRVRYEYDEIGQLISAANPNSRTNLAYDAGGRLITETLISHLTQDGQYQAREHTLTHDYDELGNRLNTTLPDGKVINQLYYGSGHLYNQSLYDPSTDDYIELRHSERNKLHQEISRQQGSLTSSYNYDPMGRLIKQYSSSDAHITIQRDYHYDVLGQLTHLSGHSVLGSNKRTEQNTAIQNQQSQFTRNHQYQYDTQGRLIEHKLTDYQNHTGITEVFAFDPASNRVPVKLKTEYDNNDLLAKVHTAKDQGRPRELIQDGKRIRYTYDSHGRVLYKTIEAIDHPDTAPRSALQLQYNANNELEKSLRTQYQDNSIVKTLTEYHYDAFGRRITKHSETRNFIQSKERLKQSRQTQHQHTHMLWDSDLPIQEYTDTHVYTTIYDQGSFVPIARLIWLRDDLPKVANDDVNQITHEQDSNAIQVYHYHNDQLGTPNELTNEKGEVVWLADYEAWGEARVEMCWVSRVKNSLGNCFSGARRNDSAVKLVPQDESCARVGGEVLWREQVIDQIQVSQNELQPIRFQGQHFDEETGLHYNRFRYYDPDMGMFTTRDPIGLRGGDNVFQYAPNPTGWVDPLGLENWSMLQNYGNSPGMKSSIHDAKTKYENIQNGKVSVSKPPIHANKTIMANLTIAGQLGLGGDVTFGAGKSYDKNGRPSQCYAITPCIAGGASAEITGGITGSVANASTSPGFGSTSQACIDGAGTAGIGATSSLCQGADGSTTGSAGMAIGGGGGVTGKACQAFTYCR